MTRAQSSGSVNCAYVVVWDCESDSSFGALPGSTHADKLKFMNFTVICAVCMPVDLILENAPNEVILAQSSSHTWWRDAADAADDGSNPVASLLELFDGASLIVGYNCLSFDFPLVRRFYRRSDTSSTPEDRYLSHRVCARCARTHCGRSSYGTLPVVAQPPEPLRTLTPWVGATRGVVAFCACTNCERSKTFDIMTRVKDVSGNYYKLEALLELNGIQRKTGDGMRAIQLWTDNKRDELEKYCHNDVVVCVHFAGTGARLTRRQLHAPPSLAHSLSVPLDSRLPRFVVNCAFSCELVTARLALSPRIKINEVSCVSAPCVGLSHQLRAATTHAQPADDFVMV